MYVVERMREEDIPEVTQIERISFSTTWSPQAYRRELRDNRLARYIVARWVDDDQASDEAVSKRELPAPDAGRGVASGIRRAVSQLFGLWREEDTSSAAPAKHRLGGYAGLWLMVDEAHITTIAVRPHLRGRGLGELLMIAMADAAIGAGADKMTLEVRVSNYEAQSLYRKFGFREEGIRRRYYSDNNEDAVIMWSEPLTSPEFTKRLAALRREVQEKMARNPLPPP